MMYFCYIDESGTPEIPGTSSHYVLCGISIPIDKWKKCDSQIHAIKKKYGLGEAEIHTGNCRQDWKLEICKDFC
jgi:hypothetical protein